LSATKSEAEAKFTMILSGDTPRAITGGPTRPGARPGPHRPRWA
jgi:hypothetical protein